MNTKTFGTWSTKEISSRERDRDRGYAPESNRLGGWKREGDSARELAKERETKEQIRSQDLKSAGVRWLH